jgi:hypothetical protein
MLCREQRFGAAAGERDCLGIMLGTGVGGAVILDGQVIHGRRGAAAEIGHMPLTDLGSRPVAAAQRRAMALPPASDSRCPGTPQPAGRQTAMLWRREYSPKLEKP